MGTVLTFRPAPNMWLTEEATSTVHLPYSPCCLDFLDRPSDILIVGTYELDNSTPKVKSNPSNHRSGSLSVFKSGKLLFESSNLTDGGVFDLKILSQDLIAVAHSNGYVSFYKVDYDSGVIDCLLRRDTGCSLLTSIDVITASESAANTNEIFAVVGDSEGSIIFLEGNLTTKEDLTCTSVKENQIEQPVWCTRLLNCWRGQFLLFTGSDDCTLKVFHIKRQRTSATLLQKNKDAGSGITSIYIEPSESSSDSAATGTLYTGSYDEHLRKYRYVFDGDTVTMQLLGSIRIEGSGVWSIRAFDSLLFIAGMYSGIHVIEPQKLSLLHSRAFDCEEGRDEEREPSELIYDVVPFNGLKRLAVVSFYRKVLYFISVQRNHVENKTS